MDYISVKETSKKFHLSERRIQKLCETNRIEGCKMVSGIWLIPASATKPSDERMTNFPKDSDYLSLKELCDKIYQLDLKRYQVAFNSEQLFQTTKKRDQLVLQDFLELYNKIKKDRNKEDEYARNSRS